MSPEISCSTHRAFRADSVYYGKLRRTPLLLITVIPLIRLLYANYSNEVFRFPHTHTRTEKRSTGIRPCDVTVVPQVQKAIELLVHGERTTWLLLCYCWHQPIQHRLQHFLDDGDDDRSMSCARATVKNQIKAIILSISLSFLTLTSNNFIQTLANLHTTRNFSVIPTSHSSNDFIQFYDEPKREREEKTNRKITTKCSGTKFQSRPQKLDKQRTTYSL